ncbi:GntR family transcriptional regulator [Clostridium botulinum]|uniref:GntR family transcriptional regulator n=1 Tax=Clostridium botulinum TaxID=1491 RepID=A0A9Q1UYH4_CLOBO|nr:GntR family transcriptional regulator [Clostridium botulinum]AEB75327.1 transcriptional regulator, GntR family [Clostridium botulinum BKT015925]KEI02314.1 GntR family transcriptional regulator [Clostridium botulinum D str. 16868]KEI04561.1 GntR family transcriptional regulator [Clostridium botulinum C/D str. Sp77]KLU75117.1 GntR family transcriptional regulator [Clostridium botulinum V891]KOA75090.1 GntR family transcriptional regulator [Clostridium botulinum]
MKIVSKENPLPLHYQLKEIIRELIENDELKSGDIIPTERELCKIQNVSRMTVNKAILALVNEGLLHRQQGKGTFVSEPKKMHQLSELKGFTEEMNSKGFKTKTKILSFEIKESTKKLQNIFSLDDQNKKIIEIIRLRETDKEPVAIETTILPYSLFSNMTKNSLDGKSLYQTFKTKYNYYPEKAKQVIEPIKLNDYECTLLNQKKNALALLFSRTTYTKQNSVIEFTKAIFRSDIYKYEMILK